MSEFIKDIEQLYSVIDHWHHEAKDWILPSLIPDELVQEAYKEQRYPTYLTRTLRKSKQFAIPAAFDPKQKHDLEELVCEIFAGTLLANPLGLEFFIVCRMAPFRMASLFQMPTDNLKLRLASYYQMRFPEDGEEDQAVKEVLFSLEKQAWDLYLKANNTTTEARMEEQIQINTQIIDAVTWQTTNYPSNPTKAKQIPLL